MPKKYSLYKNQVITNKTGIEREVWSEIYAKTCQELFLIIGQGYSEARHEENINEVEISKPNTKELTR